jgi:hypothetical protein
VSRPIVGDFVTCTNIQASISKAGSLAKLRENVAAGLNNLREINANIFDLSLADIKTAKAKTDAELATNADAQGLPKYGPTEAPMTGGGGHPDFTAIEGVGMAYKGGAKSKDGYLESDHVIDKIYPLTAQKAALSADVKAVRAAALDKTPQRRFTKVQSARLALLKD